MVFQSFAFLIFFIIVLLASFFAKGRLRQCLMFCASIFFYTWGAKYGVLLLVAVTLWTYCVGRMLGHCRTKAVLVIGIAVTVAPLLFFKYWDALRSLFSADSQSSIIVSNLMPIGISFFTFQAIGYLVDVYRKKTEAERDLLVYGLFICFFPQVLSGPIGRSDRLISQYRSWNLPDYDMIAGGLRLMGIGLVYKVLCADSIAYIVDRAYAQIESVSAVTLLMAVLLYSIQIYADFHGYTTIARGCAKTLGIDLAVNFHQPYLSKSVGDFWRRWHISLSSWLRDYVYISLGGNRKGKARKTLNLLVTFLLSGMWHGSGLNFPIWGLLNGVYLSIEDWFRLPQRLTPTRIGRFVGGAYTFCAITFSWIFFRAATIGDAFTVIGRIFTEPAVELYQLFTGARALSSVIDLNGLYLWRLLLCLGSLAIYMLFEALENRYGGVDVALGKCRPVLRWTFYVLLMAITISLGSFGETVNEFLYYRF